MSTGAILSGNNPFVAELWSGDKSDVPPTAYGSSVDGGAAWNTLGSLADGNSCTLFLEFLLDNAAGETDADSTTLTDIPYVPFSNAPTASIL